MEKNIILASLDDRWKVTLYCMKCENFLIEQFGHKCKIVGEIPLEVWNEEKECPYRKYVELTEE